MSYRGQEFFVVSRKDLIASKRASARAEDVEDVRLYQLVPQASTSAIIVHHLAVM